MKPRGDEKSQRDGGMNMSYWRFAAMIATSTVVMFGLMYLNTYAWTTCSGARRAPGWRW